MSVHSHSSFSGGSTASSTRRSEEGGGGGGEDEWDEDPSFSSAHFHTSTPLKAARAVRVQRSPNAEDEDEGADEERAEEEGMLKASDTESVGDEREDNKGSSYTTRTRLTRRSLSYQPTPHSNSQSLSQQTFTSSRPFSPSAGSSALTPRAVASTNLQQPSYPAHLAPGYTPSASTGSSTLVDRDDPLPFPPSSTRTIKGKAREDVTIRPSPRPPFSTLDDEDSPPLQQDDDGSSSSPRPLRSKPRRGVELSTYINSHTSTPPPSSRPRSSNPSTPLAPGAYPPTARKPLPRRSPPSSISHNTPPPPPPAGSRQVHDAFQRYITGPSGALIHSAERRAAAAAAAMVVPPSAARRKDYPEQQQREPPTPHPAGYYAFEASTSLPVEREQRRRRGGIPLSEERRRREVTWREDVAGGEEEGAADEEEEARAGDSPSHRPSSRAGAPSKLEKTLRHMSQLQRETEGRRRIFEAPPPPPPPPNLDDYFVPTAEYEEGEVEPEQEQEQEQRARARDYEGDYSSEDDDRSEEEAPRLAGRSAIDFAMARSFAVSSGDQSVDEEESVAEKEQPATLPPAASSPPRSFRRSPFRPPSPPSPSLPELPPLPSPQSSPTKPRAPLRRSPAAHDPPRPPPPPPPLSQPSPPRAPPQPSPPRPLIPATSPPRTRQRPSSSAIPTSSTPPCRFIEPPAPAGTPLAAAAIPTRRVTSLSSSLQAPRADPAPTPRRRATSLSPSRSPRQSAEPPMLDEHDSLPAIVADLAVAVRALSSTSASGAELRRDGLPAPRGGGGGSSLAGVLARRKKESEGRTRGLEEELRVLESRVGGEAATREAVLSRLGQAQEVEKDLSAKIDELMRSIEQMGQAVGTQVANVVHDTLQDEARQRTSWFAVAFFLQLLIFFIFTRITASRNSDLYQTLYYDPFSPSLFHLSSAAYSDSASVLPQTLELFGPRLGGAGTVDVVKSWFGGRLREVAAWEVEQSVEGRGWVPS